MICGVDFLSIQLLHENHELLVVLGVAFLAEINGVCACTSTIKGNAIYLLGCTGTLSWDHWPAAFPSNSSIMAS
jgi:hypothetical protein